MLSQRMIVTKIDDILELMKDYATDIGKESKAIRLEYNPQLAQLALVFLDPNANPSSRATLLAKFETKRVFSAGGTTVA